ncbi:MAG: SPOR domain-containing protein [Zoogloeaceae bacterium]|nr:SPOR domain-containing protein [Zoogloeaceae bacterium]
MNDADDVQSQQKKKARRRLVGAIAFVAFVALALPLVMNSAPQPTEQDVEIHIPNPNAVEPLPLPAPAPDAPVISPAPPEPVSPEAALLPPATPPTTPPATPPATARPAQSAPQQPATTTPATPARPATAAPASNPAPNPAADAEARRAAAILSGQLPGETTTVASAANANAPHVIQIGAFADAANVENLKKKLRELKIPVYTEALDAPQGAKTRVRAGPFKNRAAAEAALIKMQRIGVDGRIAPQS